MASARRGRRFDWFEVVLIAVLTFAMGWVLKPSDAAKMVRSGVLLPMFVELDAFEKTYGPDKYSWGPEEWMIRDFFKGQRDGFFLDVGANHYRNHSNTYYLEKELGWSGIAVEPLTAFAADYATHRPRTKFRPFFVSDVSNDEAKMYMLKNNSLVTSADPNFVKRHGELSSTEIKAPTITLNDLLAAEGVERIDFMSMDIELWEPKALAGFDLAKYKPTLVCIEGHVDVRQQILEYFLTRGYMLVGRYLRADVYNLYFAPADHPALAQ